MSGAETTMPAAGTSPQKQDCPPGRRPLLSVVTVFWNGAEDCPRFFEALAQARDRLPFGVETIAIDNASTDGTAGIIAERYPEVHLVRNEKNVGFAPACNQGIEVSHGRFILLLNPDCEANAEALAAMARHLARNPRVGAVGCRLLHGDGLPQQSWHREPSALSYWGSHSLISPALLRLRKLWYRTAGSTTLPIRAAWLMGACLMVPRTVIRKAGALDPDYFMYSEDADWCRRIRDAGYDVVHLPRWQLIHHHGTSARRSPEFTFRRLYRSMLRYSLKHDTAASSLALRAAVFLDMSLRIPIYSLTGNRDRLQSVRTVMTMYRRANPDYSIDEAPRN